jgi:hypothetical protein
MKNILRASAFAAIGLLYACAQHGTIPAPSNLTAPSGITGESLSPQTIIRHGNFSEYTLPAGVFPSDLTRGPYDTLWFAKTPGPLTEPARVVELVTGTGATHIFTAGKVPSGDPFLPPSQLINAQNEIISVGRAVIFAGEDPDQQDQVWLIRVTPEGAFSYQPAATADAGLTNFTLGADGNIWYGFCPFSECTSGVVEAFSPSQFQTFTAVDPRLDDGYCPNWVQSGPLNDLYASASDDSCNLSPPVGLARVYVITTAGTIVHRFPLPTGSKPGALVTGSDRNLWIVEPGINKIARMTPAGVVTQFSMRTSNAGLSRITPGADGALWFTEKTANKIGRITTSGAISEFSIPTANSGASGIVTCTTACPPHGGVWFTETTANRIGKFVSPL